MRVLDVLNLNLRELNYHEEVYSQEAIRAVNRPGIPGDSDF